MAAYAQPAPGLRIEVVGEPVVAVEGARPGCDADDIPDAPARAVRLADGTVELYAADQRNRVEAGPDLLHVRHNCRVVMLGGGNDDPAAYDDRAWIASPWSPDGRTIWAVVHNEFQGHRRPALCPSRRYMDCWFNSLTEAVSHDGGHTFARLPGPALVAALPYRYTEVGLGHHGYFNPSNIITLDGIHYMFAFATQANAQRAGNCLLRTTTIERPQSWRAWNGSEFDVQFANPYTEDVRPEQHVCAPVALQSLRYPITSLVRHQSSGLFVALMQDGGHGGGIYYATSSDLVVWSAPVRLMQAVGLSAWACGDPAPIAYPSMLDPLSTDQNFETVGSRPVLFATRFNMKDCSTIADRELIRWPLLIPGP